MGLRETNAARTRAMVVEGAMELFLSRGYETTTMEDVAQHVEISASTLYRYFVTKEALALAPIGEPGLMAAELTQRPQTEDVGVSMGHALLRLLEEPRSDVIADERWMELIRQTPRLAVQLLEWYREEQACLTEALASRMSTTPEDIRVVLAATIATAILERAADPRSRTSPDQTPGDVARALMQQIDIQALPMPCLAERPPTG